jgi:hypothetical protein
MQIPKSMREQIRIYEREGFVLERLEQINASHFKAQFEGVPQIQFLTAHTGDRRSVRNNIARMRRSRNEANSQPDLHAQDVRGRLGVQDVQQQAR